MTIMLGRMRAVSSFFLEELVPVVGRYTGIAGADITSGSVRELVAIDVSSLDMSEKDSRLKTSSYIRGFTIGEWEKS